MEVIDGRAVVLTQDANGPMIILSNGTHAGTTTVSFSSDVELSDVYVPESAEYIAFGLQNANSYQVWRSNGQQSGTRQWLGISDPTTFQATWLRVTSTHVIYGGITEDNERGMKSVRLPTWQNADRPSDVNRDGHVSPLDALLVINELTFPQFVAAPGDELPLYRTLNAGSPMPDVDGNQLVTPLDALLVINEL